MRGSGSAFGSIDGEHYSNFCIVFSFLFLSFLTERTHAVSRARISYDGCSGVIGLAEGKKLHMTDLSID